MGKRRFYYIGFNILPIVVSIILFLSVSSNEYYLWVWYDALIVPLYLLLCNFLINRKHFSGIKLLTIPLVIVFCLIIHMAYFSFDFGSISLLIWQIVAGISFGIVIVGGIILFFVSKRLRSNSSKVKGI